MARGVALLGVLGPHPDATRPKICSGQSSSGAGDLLLFRAVAVGRRQGTL